MRVPINFTGGIYQHKSRPLTSQFTRNFWPQLQTSQKEKSDYILQSFYGTKLFASQSGSRARGELYSNNYIYRVVDTNLYKVDFTGTHTLLGNIVGSARCTIRALADKIIIVNGGGIVYVWDGTTLTQNTDPNLGSPRGCAVLNNQAIYDQGTGQIFDVSDVGDPLTISGLNNASAESMPDGLLIPYVFRDTLYLFGFDSIELWWNSGQGNPPVERIQGAGLNIGLGAINSVATTPDNIFFVGNDRAIHALTAGSSAVDTVISPPAMVKQMQDYSSVADAEGFTMQLEGQWFYVVTFPSENVTWVLPMGGEWFQWGAGVVGKSRAAGYCFAFGKHIVADAFSGDLLELDAQTYTDVGDTIVRERVSAPIHGGLFQAHGKPFTVNSLELFLEVGNGLVTGQGSDPEIMLSFSKDGGKTFGTQRIVKTGKLGDNRRVVRLNNLGRFTDFCAKLSVSDPVYWGVYNGVLDVEVCI